MWCGIWDLLSAKSAYSGVGGAAQWRGRASQRSRDTGGSQRYIKPIVATFPRYLGNAIIFFLGRSSGLHCKISAITFAAYTCVRVVSSSANFEMHPCRPSAYRSLPRGNCRVHFSLLPCSIPHSFINNCSPCQHQSCASLHQRSQHSHNLTILDTRGVSELFSVFFPYGF